MKKFHPGGESGVLLKSNVPSSAVYTGIWVLPLYCLSKLNVKVHCFSRQQNKCIGHTRSVLYSPEMKLSFQVWISRSAEFL